MRVILDIAGDVQLNRELVGVGEHASNLEPAFEAVADLWISETKMQFDTEGRHASGGWKPLALRTVEAKQRKKLRPQILRATDRLKFSLTYKGSADMVLNTGPDELEYGSKVPYASVHQRPKTTNPLPQRRPVELTESARVRSVKLIQRFLMTGAAA